MITVFSRPLRGAVGLCAVLSLTTIACQRMALLAPSGSTITLSTLTSTLPLSGTTNIIAHVIEPAGTPPQKGTLVSFTTSLGTIDPVEAETDAGGRVMVTFKANGQSGTATISAVSGGVRTLAEGAIRISIGAAGVASVSLTAAPPTIAPGGSSTISATVTDTGGAVVAGVPVTFTTDVGAVSPSVVMTNANGVASTVLTSTRTAKVTATSGVGTTGTTPTAAPTASVTVTVEPLPTVTISASGNAQVGQPVTFTINATAGANGTGTIENVDVTFGDGDSVGLGAAAGTSTVQHVYQSGGPKTARATATDSNDKRSSSATVVFVQPRAPIVSLTSTKTVTGPNTDVIFRATVTPPESDVAQYVWTFGDGTSTTTTTNTVTRQYPTASLPRTATVTVTTTTGQTASSSTTVS